MRKTLIAIALAATALTTLTTTASAANLPARHDATGTLLGSPASSIMAYTTSAGVVLKRDSGSARTVAPPAGCRISAVGSYLLAGACRVAEPSGTAPRSFVVLRLDGSEVRRLTLPPVSELIGGEFEIDTPDSVGGQWLTATGGCIHCSVVTEAVNWRTGEVRELVDQDPTQVLDLDAPGLTAPLCAPLRRAVTEADSEKRVQPVILRGGYALVEDVSSATLRRCGSAAAVKLPGGFVPGALGDGWVARIVRLPHIGFHAQVLRLADRRLFTITGTHIPWTVSGRDGLWFTHGRLYVQGWASSRSEIYSVALPKRQA